VLSVPAHMPATTVASFGAGLAAPEAIRGTIAVGDWRVWTDCSAKPTSSVGAGSHAGEDRRCGDRCERHNDGEIGFDGVDFGTADDRGQREGSFEHGEVIADARAWPSAKWQVPTRVVSASPRLFAPTPRSTRC
jgi:hypothetical protein